MNQTVNTEMSIFMAVIASFFTFIDISIIQMGVLAALMSIDFVAGLVKSYRINPQNIKSETAKIGIISKLLYLLVPIVIALAMKGLNIEGIGLVLVNFSINAMILSEAYSILANIYAFKYKKEVEEIDAISYILKMIKNQIERMLK